MIYHGTGASPILAEAECTITRVKQATAQGRQKLAENKAAYC